MGCDVSNRFFFRQCRVSIHAPTWGATLSLRNAEYFTQFQSTHPHGVRLSFYFLNLHSSSVSIHAPTWGATTSRRKGSRTLLGFNPRTHMGCDKMCALNMMIHGMFQSTHPHGVRLKICTATILPSMFQSTHPHGVRLTKTIFCICSIAVSIHAPTWGATYIVIHILYC